MSSKLFKCLTCQITLNESSHSSANEAIKHLSEKHNIKLAGDSVQEFKHWSTPNESTYQYLVNEVLFQVVFIYE